jgi:Na+/H+ antiporter NhaD/arsenite permease-like protein
MLSVLILALVFILIAVRQVAGVKLRIWQVMLGGAMAVLLLGQITPAAAAASINIDVMLFLFGMFVVGQALEESGYLSHLSFRAFESAKNRDHLLLLIIFGTGFASAFLMNDTLAIVGTPVALHLARTHKMPPKSLLLALCFSVTIGSVMSPIGNPQNLLIAIGGGFENPFPAFFIALFTPTIINLFLCYLLIRAFCKGGFGTDAILHDEEPIRDAPLAFLSKISLAIIVVLIAMKVLIVSSGMDADFRLTYIALAAAAPLLIVSPRRIEILRGIDWHTLIFFAAMFILMESVWESGFFQSMINGSGADISSTGMVLAVGVVISQFISNVPLVALYLPLLVHAGASTAAMIALAAGSTIAGNLTILGAASNVIIIQNAEKKSGETITFMEFARIGVPLTILNVLVYWLFLSL